MTFPGKGLVFATAITAVVALSAPALGGAQGFDSKSGSASATITDKDMKPIAGKFSVFSGEIILEEGDLTSNKVDVKIRSDSFVADPEFSKQDLLDDDPFDSENYPEITFVSTEIVSTGENTAHVTGDMTIRDVTLPVTLAVVYDRDDAGKIDGFTASGTVKRKQFGMSYGQDNFGEDITLVLHKKLAAQ